MRRQMNEALDDGFRQYSMQEQGYKQSAQPVINYTFPNPQKYTNPPENFDDTEDTSRDGQSIALTKAEQDLSIKKQRAQVLRERAGLMNDQPPRKLKTEHKKWGNFLVLYEGSFSITLGPDYWCFIPTFICFLIMSIGILSLLFSKTQSIVAKLGGLLVCGAELMAYLLMAMSNPGIAQQEDDHLSLEQYEHPQKSEPMRMCAKCGFAVPRSSYHCQDCDVCILGYDHHCPWTSKCIGKNNVCRFYTFLGMTPIFLVFIAISFVMIMSQEASITRRQNIRKLLETQIF